jgi:hypothetical protein
MIVGEPNGFAAEIHDRMPLFLTEGQFTPLLSEEADAEFLKPVPMAGIEAGLRHRSTTRKNLGVCGQPKLQGIGIGGSWVSGSP